MSTLQDTAPPRGALPTPEEASTMGAPTRSSGLSIPREPGHSMGLAPSGRGPRGARARRRRGAYSRDGRVTFEDRTRHGPNGKRVKYRVWGYTLGSKSARKKVYREEWTEQDASEALRHAREARAGDRLTTRRDRTFAVVAAEYLDAKRRTHKRSVNEDERILLRGFGPAFGPECRLRAITREMIAQYRERRLAQVAINTVRNELSVLRHLLRSAVEVGDLDTVPGIKLPSPPDDRVRYLEPDEIERLLAACRASRNRTLWHVVRSRSTLVCDRTRFSALSGRE